jgi:outer membrane biosynthesis protein TonB
MDRAEATGLGVSFVGHVALLALLSVALVTATNHPITPPAMEVSFVDEAGLTSAAPQPSHEAPAIGAAPEVGPVEDAAPAPTPAPAQLQPLPPAPVAPPRAMPTPRPAPIERPPQQAAGTGNPTTRRLSGDILNGIGDDRVSTSNAPTATMTGEARASIRSLIARALMPCQRQPLPVPEAEAIKVDFRVTLNRDGSLANAEFVRVINPDPNLARYELRMRDLALNVLRGCTPIRGLPAEYYDVPRGWRQFPYQFDPRNGR